MARQLTDEDLESFNDIYEDGKEVNPIPEGVKVTVYCESDSEEGYVDNVTVNEMGLELLIAKKWQYQTVVDEMLKDKD